MAQSPSPGRETPSSKSLAEDVSRRLSLKYLTEPISIDSELLVDGLVEYHHNLIGKFISDHPINMTAAKKTTTHAWNSRPPVSTINLAHGFILFKLNIGDEFVGEGPNPWPSAGVTKFKYWKVDNGKVKLCIMFKKSIEAKALQRLSGADRKKLKRTIKERFPQASDADIDVILPPKAEITVAKFPNRVHVFGVEGGFPMLFDVDGRGTEIFPTGHSDSGEESSNASTYMTGGRF
ncbi:hypothetical protein HHK36_004571 [Tetracentron sinense]|uniref:Pre-PUA domain-containing protein n=1 Tax=Tetracentron sinense TaxID=13715 RepID=A0A835A0S2_TETSI|nr:hypothetical protein HHK36_004571 [Tetracentron sinense]